MPAPDWRAALAAYPDLSAGLGKVGDSPAQTR